ncbi:hypothetical protein CIW54_13405 [Paraburkholderia sp. T12-10]|nr:hypothetical protein CIW54_13405 [Paraburkholderia sp. T12-10]
MRYATSTRVGERLANRPNSRSFKKTATGTVKWFNDAKRLGVVTPNDAGEDLSVHFSSHVNLSKDPRQTAARGAPAGDTKTSYPPRQGLPPKGNARDLASDLATDSYLPRTGPSELQDRVAAPGRRRSTASGNSRPCAAVRPPS